MLETYQGILHDNRIEWSGEAPQSLPADQAVRVHVTLLEKMPVPNGNQGQRMAAALESLAASRSLEHINDPVAWQREAREDRPLPGRE
ncbi:MAG: hypothetical protein K2R98_22055 [Gemmataceae bacterium]|nr:hypothetical protein [Gemmataceae bacterium]